MSACPPTRWPRCVSARIGWPALSVSSRAIVESTSYSGASLIAGTVRVVQDGEVLGVRVRVADGHVERRAAQQAGHVAGVAEVPEQAGEVAQCRAALLLVLQPGRRGGRLAAVLLVHPDRDAPGWCVLPVVAPDRQHGKPGDVEQLGLAPPRSPHAAASRRQVASLAAIACGPSGLRIHVEGASP